MVELLMLAIVVLVGVMLWAEKAGQRDEREQRQARRRPPAPPPEPPI